MTSVATDVVKPVSFAPFTQLPIEIRLIIWLDASRKPRNIFIKYAYGSLRSSNRVANRPCHLFAQELPGTLGACRESRQEALLLFKPLLTKTLSGKPLLVNFDLDTFIFTDYADLVSLYGYHPSGFSDAPPSKEFQEFELGVQHLAYRSWNVLWDFFHVPRRMRNLKTLTLPVATRSRWEEESAREQITSAQISFQ